MRLLLILLLDSEIEHEHYCLSLNISCEIIRLLFISMDIFCGK